jgi:hypothetical protein
MNDLKIEVNVPQTNPNRSEFFKKERIAWIIDLNIDIENGKKTKISKDEKSIVYAD